MMLGKRVPGERLANRLTLRLRRADTTFQPHRLSTRLAQRAAAGTALGSGLLRRLERWPSSSMLAWARGAESPAAPRWGAFGPELVLAWSPDDVTDEPAAARPRRVRRARPARAARRSAATQPTVVPPVAVPSAPGVAPAAAPAAPLPSVAAPQLARQLVASAPVVPSAPAGLPSPSLRPGIAVAPARAPWPGGATFERAERRLGYQPRRVAPVSSRWAVQMITPAPADGAPSHPGAAQPAAQRPASAPTGAVRRTPGTSRPRPVVAHPQPLATPAAQGRNAGVPSRIRRSVTHPDRSAGSLAPSVREPARPARPALRGLAQRTQLPDPIEVLADGGAPPHVVEPGHSALPSPAPAGRLSEQLASHPSRGIITALARAGTPQRAAEVALAHATQLADVRSLPTPLAEIVRELGRQSQQAAASQATPSGSRARSAPKRPSAAQERAQRQVDQVLRAKSGTPVVSLASQRLIRRLQNLVHIAECDRRRLEAQRQVRMAEDSAHARAQAQSAPGTDAASGEQPIDLDALRREVLTAVNRIKESRTVRRLEDPDVSFDVF